MRGAHTEWRSLTGNERSRNHIEVVGGVSDRQKKRQKNHEILSVRTEHERQPSSNNNNNNNRHKGRGGEQIPLE